MTEKNLPRVTPFAGAGEMRSVLFSRTWELLQQDRLVATAHRSVWRRTSEVSLPGGREWLIRPGRWGVVELVEDDQKLASAERGNWLGRTWDLKAESFAYELHAQSMALRRWSIELGGGVIGTLTGGAFSFNRLKIEAGLPLPLEALMLSWHVIVRAWEAAATSGGGA